MYNTFIPLAPGEAPGDPELGGWRPLPKSLFRKRASLTVPSVMMNLEQAVKLVGFMVQYLNLKRAVEALATGFTPSSPWLMKGGVPRS